MRRKSGAHAWCSRAVRPHRSRLPTRAALGPMRVHRGQNPARASRAHQEEQAPERMAPMEVALSFSARRTRGSCARHQGIDLQREPLVGREPGRPQRLLDAVGALCSESSAKACSRRARGRSPARRGPKLLHRALGELPVALGASEVQDRAAARRKDTQGSRRRRGAPGEQGRGARAGLRQRLRLNRAGLLRELLPVTRPGTATPRQCWHAVRGWPGPLRARMPAGDSRTGNGNGRPGGRLVAGAGSSLGRTLSSPPDLRPPTSSYDPVAAHRRTGRKGRADVQRGRKTWSLMVKR